MKNIKCKYIGEDDWGRPLIETIETNKKESVLICDVNLTRIYGKGDLKKCDWCICTKWGEPEYSIKKDMSIKIVNFDEMKKNPQEFEYMLLARLQSDCKYYLGNGQRDPKHLWAHDEKKQITKMEEIYNNLKIKPEWITIQEIEDYKKNMVLD